jgi:RNA polymerase sigma-70 factor (ECF subfamily)
MNPSAANDWVTTLAKRHRWLRSVAGMRSGEPAAVDDIMQDVAVAAAKNHASLRDQSALPAWLYQLTVAAALQHRRRCGRQRKLVERFVEKVQPQEAVNQSPDDWLLASERDSMVRTALKQLCPKDAEILMLKYGHGWTYQQLADRLGKSPSAIDGRLQRARKRLRCELARMANDSSTTQSRESV